jgi:two-component system response regulator (stage 0 sporulation protein A)
MLSKTKVLVADDNGMTREMMHQGLLRMEEVQVVGMAANGQEALDMLRKTQPDILILDLVMPVLDGVGVLEEICRMPGKHPDVLVLSAMGSEDVVNEVMRYSVRYFMVKPFEIEQICRRVRDIIDQNQGVKSMGMTMGLAPRTRSVDEEITSVFLTIGIPAHIKGYQYLREAVKMVMADKQLIGSITKELYPGIAEHFDTSASKVERAIRHAIDVAWTKGRIENINRIFGYNIYTLHDKPTNGEFIALLADKMAMEHTA